MFSKILFPTDGSEISRRAADTAVALAAKLGVGIVGFHSIPPFSLPLLLGETGAAACMRMAEHRSGNLLDLTELQLHRRRAPEYRHPDL